MLKRFEAFTLAEVLITLGIIGVVSAMTIPTLVANYQKTQYVTALKKAYSEINQALVKMASDAGCPGDLSCASTIFNSNSSADELVSKLDNFASYFNAVKKCQAADGVCFSTQFSNYYDGSGVRGTGGGGPYSFIKADGVSYSVTPIECQPPPGYYGFDTTAEFKTYCGDMYIDVNGPNKGPNNFGMDVYHVWFTNGKGPVAVLQGAKSSGTQYWQTANSCNSSNKNGWSCGGRIVEEGWEMNY